MIKFTNGDVNIIPSIMNIHPCVILVIPIRMSLPFITSIMNTLKVTKCGFFFGLNKFKASRLLKGVFTLGVRDSSVGSSHIMLVI
jgi:hypothetical protein